MVEKNTIVDCFQNVKLGFAILLAKAGQILDSTGQDWSLVWRSIALVDIVGATAFFLLYKSDREFE